MLNCWRNAGFNFKNIAYPLRKSRKEVGLKSFWMSLLVNAVEKLIESDYFYVVFLPQTRKYI